MNGIKSDVIDLHCNFFALTVHLFVLTRTASSWICLLSIFLFSEGDPSQTWICKNSWRIRQPPTFNLQQLDYLLWSLYTGLYVHKHTHTHIKNYTGIDQKVKTLYVSKGQAWTKQKNDHLIGKILSVHHMLLTAQCSQASHQNAIQRHSTDAQITTRLCYVIVIAAGTLSWCVVSEQGPLWQPVISAS